VNPFVASLENFTPLRRTHFGVGMAYRDGAYELMKILTVRKPDLKWASIVQDDDSGIDRENGYLRAVKELKLTSVSTQRHKRGQSDFSSEILRAKEAGATGLFLGSLPANEAAMINEAKKVGLNAQVGLVILSHVPQAIDLLGAAGNGVAIYDFVPSFDDPATAQLRELAKKYLKPADLPRMNRYTAVGYVTMRVLADAMRRCGRDLTRKCTIEQLEATKNFTSGIMPPFSFGPAQHLSAISGTGRLLTVDFANKRFVPF
jgi:branched-chain amino acid transport system substrate-binding protein